MKSAFDAIAFWLIDYYIAATIVLIVVMLAQRAISQPARRLALHWGGLVGLALLVFLCALPGWPRIDVKLLAQAVPQSADPSHLIKIHATKSKIEADESESQDRGTAASTLPISTAGQPLSSKSTPHGLSAPALSPAHRTLTDRERSEFSKAATVVATPVEAAGFFGRLASRDFWAIRAFALAFFTLGSILTVFRVVHGLLAARSVRLSASRAPRRIVAELEKLAGEERCPELLISESHPVPIVTGTLKPRILLPPQFAERERPDDCRSVLAHELAHIQNGELWRLTLDRWLLPLFWMHPLYLRLRRSLRDDQELLADSFAASHSSRTDYADMLVRWARRLVAEKQARQLAAAVGV